MDYMKRTLSTISEQLKTELKPLVLESDYGYLFDLIDYVDIDIDTNDLFLTDLAENVYTKLFNADYCGLGIPTDVSERLMKVIDHYLKTIHLDRISDEMVCQAYALKNEVRDATGVHTNPYDILHEWTGEDVEICYQCMERADRNGYIDYGVSLRTGWLTEEGKKLIV